MIRWNLSISEKTDRLVRSPLAWMGMKKGDLSKFVETAGRKEILRRTVQGVQAQNADLTGEEAMALANEAIAWARGNTAKITLQAFWEVLATADAASPIAPPTR